MRFLTGLLGSGIGASGSPALHECEARALGHTLHYHLIDLDEAGRSPADLPALLAAAQALGFAGVNVTHPCKQAVLPLLDELDPRAAAAGAVNTVIFRQGRRIGYNTDWCGFRDALLEGLPGAELGTLLLIGAGGAGHAVALGALEAGAARILIYDAEPARAQALAARLGPGLEVLPDLTPTAFQEADGVVHATPTGMASHPGLPFNPALLEARHWLAEIVYFPLETELLGAARARGCRTLDGGLMAVHQAAAAFQLFTGLVPDAARMRAQFLRWLER